MGVEAFNLRSVLRVLGTDFVQPFLCTNLRMPPFTLGNYSISVYLLPSLRQYKFAAIVFFLTGRWYRLPNRTVPPPHSAIKLAGQKETAY